MTNENGWIETDYSTKKKYMSGLVVANIAYAITGKSGYVLRINNTTFKKRFASPDDAKPVADKYVEKRIAEHIADKE